MLRVRACCKTKNGQTCFAASLFLPPFCWPPLFLPFSRRLFALFSPLEKRRTPQSAHHPHKNHDEHRQCSPGGGIHFVVLLGSDNSYTTPVEFVSAEVFRGGGIYGWWSPWKVLCVVLTEGHSAQLGEGQFQDGPLHKVWAKNSFLKSKRSDERKQKSEKSSCP